MNRRSTYRRPVSYYNVAVASLVGLIIALFAIGALLGLRIVGA